MWWTGTRGMPRAKAAARDHVTPTSSAPIRPGAAATAMAPRSPRPTPASPSAASTTGSIRLRWSRAASSGTTPPYTRCTSWEWMTSPRIAPRASRTAAEVSSQVVSIPRIGRVTAPRPRER